MTSFASNLLRRTACMVLATHAALTPAALRDPTEPPTAARAAASSSTGEPGEEATSAPPRHLIVSGGRSYVVERGRRFAVGDMLGNARIERIDGDAVWLRDGAGLHRSPLYAGVIRRPSAETPRTDPPAASAPRTERTPPKKKEAP